MATTIGERSVDLKRVISKRVDAKLAGTLRADLLAWYRRARRDLPWRRDPDPYRVWVSEVMLQQTRVETVVERYRSFLARFPDLAALARAPIGDVLAEWSGLGYYRRARALHAAANAVVERHGGVVPSGRAELLALPGVGEYTAGALASIAYDRPEALVDGNVARVLARLFALEEPLASARFTRAAWEIARALVPERGAGEWNQALMELGALVCAPQSPRCDECPLRAHCKARALGRAEELPLRGPRERPIAVELHVALARRGGRVLLARRGPDGRMAGLWEPPAIEPAGEGRLYAADWPAGARFALGAELGSHPHTITRHKIRARVHAARLLGPARGDGWAWVRVEDAGALALTGLARKILRAHVAPRRSAGALRCSSDALLCSRQASMA